MHCFFADDSQQKKPWRSGMGPLVATGGIQVPEDKVRSLELELDGLCLAFGFPAGQEFKWSPSKSMWMRENLVDQERTKFFLQVITIVRAAGCQATVVIVDAARGRASKEAKTPEEDVTRLLMERVHHRLEAVGQHGLLIADKPGGDNSSDHKFLAACLEMLKTGSSYVMPEKLSMTVTTPSNLSRLVQAADLVTSSTCSFVSGEKQFSPPIFEVVLPMFPAHLGRIGGVGLKIHPDFIYANLYHWFLGDDMWVKYPGAYGLPMPKMPYPAGPDAF